MKVNKEPNFRNISAKRYFELKKGNEELCEYGQDDKGNLYFLYQDESCTMYTRRNFIKEAKEYYKYEFK